MAKPPDCFGRSFAQPVAAAERLTATVLMQPAAALGWPVAPVLIQPSAALDRPAAPVLMQPSVALDRPTAPAAAATQLGRTSSSVLAPPAAASCRLVGRSFPDSAWPAAHLSYIDNLTARQAEHRQHHGEHEVPGRASWRAEDFAAEAGPAAASDEGAAEEAERTLPGKLYAARQLAWMGCI